MQMQSRESDQAKLWVYAPQARFFDLIDGYDTGARGAVVGRLYEGEFHELADDNRTVIWRMWPMENGSSVVEAVGFFFRLSELAPITLAGVTHVMLRSEARVNWAGRMIGLNLGDTMEAARWPGSREAFRAVGLKEGVAYEVEEWVIPDKVLRLKNVFGCYYVGLFRVSNSK